MALPFTLPSVAKSHCFLDTRFYYVDLSSLSLVWKYIHFISLAFLVLISLWFRLQELMVRVRNFEEI